LLNQRTGLFLAAYSQLAVWQGELVAAGLKHTHTSMHHLLAALDRLGYVNDCLQLAKLNEEKKTGTFKAHRAALMVGNLQQGLQGVSRWIQGAVIGGDGESWMLCQRIHALRNCGCGVDDARHYDACVCLIPVYLSLRDSACLTFSASSSRIRVSCRPPAAAAS
jgi:hypothetical protein